MTQDTQWDTWNRSVVTIARAQAIGQALDSTYQAVLPDKVALFAEKQKYLYAVFEQTLQTDKGKAIIHAHEAAFDAQLVYKEMYLYCNRSALEQC
jgi:hypothetical protein